MLRWTFRAEYQLLGLEEIRGIGHLFVQRSRLLYAERFTQCILFSSLRMYIYLCTSRLVIIDQLLQFLSRVK